MLSFQIRTPMNGVLALTRLLSSMDLSDEQHDIVDTVLTSAEAMMRLINDLLLFSKIEAGKSRPTFHSQCYRDHCLFAFATGANKFCAFLSFV